MELIRIAALPMRINSNKNATRTANVPPVPP